MKSSSYATITIVLTTCLAFFSSSNAFPSNSLPFVSSTLVSRTYAKTLPSVTTITPTINDPTTTVTGSARIPLKTQIANYDTVQATTSIISSLGSNSLSLPAAIVSAIFLI